LKKRLDLLGRKKDCYRRRVEMKQGDRETRRQRKVKEERDKRETREVE
jgi:hypothetical protein